MAITPRSPPSSRREREYLEASTVSTHHALRRQRINQRMEGEEHIRRQHKLAGLQRQREKDRRVKARRERRRKSQEARKREVNQPGSAQEGSPGDLGNGGTSRRPGTPRLVGSRLVAERQALALATAGETALDAEVLRTQSQVEQLVSACRSPQEPTPPWTQPHMVIVAERLSS